FFSSRRRHTRFSRDWSSDVCSSDLERRFSTPEIRRSGAPHTRGAAEPCLAYWFRAGTAGLSTAGRSPRGPEGRPRPCRGGPSARSEERRVGKECRDRRSPYEYEKTA